MPSMEIPFSLVLLSTVSAFAAGAQESDGPSPDVRATSENGIAEYLGFYEGEYENVRCPQMHLKISFSRAPGQFFGVTLAGEAPTARNPDCNDPSDIAPVSQISHSFRFGTFMSDPYLLSMGDGSSHYGRYRETLKFENGNLRLIHQDYSASFGKPFAEKADLGDEKFHIVDGNLVSLRLISRHQIELIKIDGAPIYPEPAYKTRYRRILPHAAVKHSRVVRR